MKKFKYRLYSLEVFPISQSVNNTSKDQNNKSFENGIYYIHYVDATNNHNHAHQVNYDRMINSLHTVNHPGKPFNHFSQYIHNIPVGYRFQDVVYNHQVTKDGHNVPKVFPKGIRNVYIELVKPNQNNVQSRFVINYQDADKHNIQTRQMVTQSSVGKPFNVKPYLEKLGQDHVLDSVQYNQRTTPDGSNVPDHYLPGLHSIWIRYRQKTHQISSVQIMYVDQNNQVIGQIHSISGAVGDRIKLTDKYPVPKGYTLVPNQKLNYQFESDSKLITLKTTKQAVHVTYVVSQMLKDGAKVNTNNLTRHASGQVGRQIKVRAADFVPKNYHSDQSNHDQTLTITASGAQPSVVHFMYVRNRPQLSSITIHYRSADNMSQDLAQDTVKGRSGESFNVALHLTKLPKGYKLDRIVNNIPNFIDQPQNMVVQVKKIVKPKPSKVTMTINYYDIDDNSSVNQYQINGTKGTPVDYSPYLTKLVPHGYQYFKMGDYSPVYKANVQNVILVRKAQQSRKSTENPQSNRSNNVNVNQVGSILMKLGSSLNLLGHELHQHR